MVGVRKISEMVKKPRSEEAKRLLEKLACACAPLMARKNWTVSALKEFFPNNPGLLGMNTNRGACIHIRLRPAHDEHSFLPWEDLLGTMVHELTHMQIGSHSAEFYKLMDELHDEVDKDAGRVGSEQFGAAGAAFLGKSHKLGGSTAKVVSGSLSSAAAEAAIKRQKLATIMPVTGGRRLGGGVAASSSSSAPLTAADRRRLAADAAERRRRDDLWCDGTGNNKFGELFLDDDDEYEVVIVNGTGGRSKVVVGTAATTGLGIYCAPTSSSSSSGSSSSNIVVPLSRKASTMAGNRSSSSSSSSSNGRNCSCASCPDCFDIRSSSSSGVTLGKQSSTSSGNSSRSKNRDGGSGASTKCERENKKRTLEDVNMNAGTTAINRAGITQTGAFLDLTCDSD